MSVTIERESTHINKRTWGDGPWQTEPEKVWWLGFDCAHAGDISPSYQYRYPRQRVDISGWPADQYRTLEYVQEQCAGLAAQLRAMAPKPTQRRRRRIEHLDI